MFFETMYEPDNKSLLKQLGVYEQYHPYVVEASEKYNINPWVIAGIGSRESHWGLALKPKGPGGTGDHGHRKGKMPLDGLGWGRGLLQVDYFYHEFARTDNWKDPRENILYGVSLVSKNLIYLRRVALKQAAIAALGEEEILRAALSGYNAGPTRVMHSICRDKGIDSCTTGGDYSADVLSRAGWFQRALLVST